MEETTTHHITGTLADRIRRRFGAPRTSEVFIDEHYSEYGDWTVEIYASFDVRCGDEHVTFYPDRVDEHSTLLEPRAGDSVFARFDAWLNAATTVDEDGYAVEPVLLRAAGRSCGRALSSIQFRKHRGSWVAGGVRADGKSGYAFTIYGDDEGDSVPEAFIRRVETMYLPGNAPI